MNEQAMKMMMAGLITRKLQSENDVENVRIMREAMVDLYEGILWSIDERINELEDTNNEN